MSAKRKPKISKPATATTTTTNRKLFPIITVMMIAVISVIIGLYLYNSNKEYQMSKHQREVNNSLQDVQKRINEVPDDPEKLAYTYEDTEFFKKGDNSFYDDIPATLLEHDITPVDEEYQKRVDEIGKDVLKFINTTYHKTWKYLSVPTFFYADEMQEMLGKYKGLAVSRTASIDTCKFVTDFQESFFNFIPFAYQRIKFSCNIVIRRLHLGIHAQILILKSFPESVSLISKRLHLQFLVPQFFIKINKTLAGIKISAVLIPCMDQSLTDTVADILQFQVQDDMKINEVPVWVHPSPSYES